MRNTIRCAFKKRVDLSETGILFLIFKKMFIVVLRGRENESVHMLTVVGGGREKETEDMKWALCRQ